MNGKPAGWDIWAALTQDLVPLWCEWKLMKSLYAAPIIFRLLQTTAPTFFRVVHDIIGDHLMLAIARYCDPPRTAGHDNISLDALLEKADPAKADTRWQPIRTDVGKFKTMAAPITTHRMKRLAHTDAMVRLAGPTPNLQGVTVACSVSARLAHSA
jgi:hypothetical protein